MFLRKCSLGVILALAVGTVTHADQPTLSIQQQATLIDAGAPVGVGVDVTVVVNCEGSTVFEVTVGVRQGDIASESVVVDFLSNGGRQEVPVFVQGPFEPGEADASAVLECSLLLEGLVVGQSIKITD